MNLLTDHDITFDHDDNLAQWHKEYLVGVTINDGNRSVDKELQENMDTLMESIHTSDKSNLEWDSSSGVFGLSYYKDVDNKSLCSRVRNKIFTSIDQIDKAWQKYDSKWTWDGAPEFKDWSFNGKNVTEIAIIK